MGPFLLVFLTNCFSNFPSSTKPPLHTCTQAIFFCKTLHLKCLEVFWIRFCLDNCSVIYTVTLCCLLHQTHSEFWHTQNSVSSAARCVTPHIHKLTIFWTMAYLELEAYSKPCETLTMHSQSSLFRHYSAIFRYIWNLV